jgi:predicted transcriptional regulator
MIRNKKQTQNKILKALVRLGAVHPPLPSYRHVEEESGVPFPTISGHVRELKAKGLIEYIPGESRTIHITAYGIKWLDWIEGRAEKPPTKVA